jgi:hypothetical protein
MILGQEEKQQTKSGMNQSLNTKKENRDTEQRSKKLIIQIKRKKRKL